MLTSSYDHCTSPPPVFVGVMRTALPTVSVYFSSEYEIIGALAVGSADGLTLGGAVVGDPVGPMLGSSVGLAVGDMEGPALGVPDGLDVVGEAVGAKLGLVVGVVDGAACTIICKWNGSESPSSFEAWTTTSTKVDWTAVGTPRKVPVFSANAIPPGKLPLNVVYAHFVVAPLPVFIGAIVISVPTVIV